MNELTLDEIVGLKPGVRVWIVKKAKTGDSSDVLYRGSVLETEAGEGWARIYDPLGNIWSSKYRHFFLNYWDAYKAVRKIWGHEK